jgi:hypothetical protein
VGCNAEAVLLDAIYESTTRLECRVQQTFAMKLIGFIELFLVILPPTVAFISPLTMQRQTRQRQQADASCIAIIQTQESPIPPPPSISLPVWSLAAMTKGNTNVATSMNIVTYAIPVSVASPKLWILSLYHGTLTKDSFLSAGGGVLQLLVPLQKHLVGVLGKQSGKDIRISKSNDCAEQGYSWTRSSLFGDVNVLPGCASYIQLHVKECMEAGDHVAVLCEVVKTATWDEAGRQIIISSNDNPTALDQSTVLYSGLLRDEGLI